MTDTSETPKNPDQLLAMMPYAAALGIELHEATPALAGGGQVLPPAPSSRPSWLSASRAGTAGPRACTLWVMGTRPVNINDVLDGHVSLSVDCIDRL